MNSTFTEGQLLSIEQLREIESISNGNLEILEVKSTKNNALEIVVSINCKAYPPTSNGFKFRDREKFSIHVGTSFPFVHPTIYFSHSRFLGKPHVNWGIHLCLYQSPSTEWDYSRGMAGFIERLDSWLADAAQNRLDPVGAPLHPPAVYIDSTAPMVVPRANTPSVKEEIWQGFPHITEKDNHFEINGWSTSNEHPPKDIVGVALLFPHQISYEFPINFSGFYDLIDKHGATTKFIDTLKAAAKKNERGQPLFVVIGTPSRGTEGSDLKQNLAVWKLDPEGVKYLQSLVKDSSSGRIQLEQKKDKVVNWLRTAPLQWCEVKEMREEIIVERDRQSPIAWFKGKSVAIWGCGAIGGNAAIMLARAGVRKITLRDNKKVTPGVLSRQPYDEIDIGRNKAEALEELIKGINPKIEVVASESDIINDPLGKSHWTEDVDVIIDATASGAVLGKTEEMRLKSQNSVHHITIVVDSTAERGLISYINKQYKGGPADVARKTKLAVTSSYNLNPFVSAFYKNNSSKLLQPEPGCSDPTFMGSSADMAALTGAMLNLAAKDLASAKLASSHLITTPHAIIGRGECYQKSFEWSNDTLLKDTLLGYEVRLSEAALNEIKGWVNQGKRLRGEKNETGGLLFGEIDDALKIVWVTEVIGPPPGSKFSPSKFTCGTEGTEKINEEKRKRSLESVQFIGMWHTHPISEPNPSKTDEGGINDLFKFCQPSPRKALLLIVGFSASEPKLGAQLFSRPSLMKLAPKIEPVNDELSNNSTTEAESNVAKQNCLKQADQKNLGKPLPPKKAKIGLALSGGGSRAMAFHLGCLRALNDRGILEQVEVISAVSGGSVIASLYAYSHDSFDDFNKRIEAILKKGLQTHIGKRTLMSKRTLQAIWTMGISGIPTLLQQTLSVAEQLIPLWPKRLTSPITSLPHIARKYSRTTAFIDVLKREDLLHDSIISNPKRKIDVVLNATDLRTLSAFRFGSRESGIWRFGKLVNNEIPVAEAVAASAAYPIMLPGIDNVMEFYDRITGEKRRERIILTDGGIYENLGVGPLEPGRSAGYGYNSADVDYIISCNAGQGIPVGTGTPYGILTRAINTSESLFRKVQDSTMNRLFQHQASGALKGVVLAYLGQQDSKLSEAPANLVPRESVMNYPTNFAAMSKTDFDLLTLRGEQLTRLLISQYCPEL
ncbi:ThiF family adenylyltransferase [Rufibacter immobilis]|uniref:ThiF family adenylyltransferase n=1 Tax=Rufibacter immobilis TaxID=1348778 RepID=UPI0035E93125